MPFYSYIAYDGSGRKVRGIVEASNKVGAISDLLQKGYSVVKIEETKGKKKVEEKKRKKVIFGINLSELAIFSRQFATMISAGIRVKNALEILSDQEVFSKRFRLILKDVLSSLEEGKSLSEAFEETGAFEPIFVNLIKAGEEGGVLDETLQKVADFYESSKALSDEVKAAMRYPIFVAGFAVLMVGVIAFYVIPNLIQRIGLSPTGIVGFLYNTNQFLTAHSIELIIGTVAAVVLIKLYLSTISGKKFKEVLLSIIPAMRTVSNNAALERFSRTLGILVGAGVSLTTAIEMAAQASNKPSMQSKASKVIELIKEGKTLRDSFEETGMVPQLVFEMAGTGEATGKLDEVMMKVADFYEQQLRISVKKFVSMIEPALIAFIGGFIAFLALSLYSTIFQFQSGAGGL